MSSFLENLFWNIFQDLLKFFANEVGLKIFSIKSIQAMSHYITQKMQRTSNY